MGKSLPSATRLQELTRIVSSSVRLQKPTKQRSASQPGSQLRVPPRHQQAPQKLESAPPRVDPERVPARSDMSSAAQSRQPLSAVVSECVRRWFHDALKEAKAGDASMQLLVGQMYYSGYGVPKDPHKGRAWINKASQSRPSVWRVYDKQPGYNASDSDSEEITEDTK